MYFTNKIMNRKGEEDLAYMLLSLQKLYITFRTENDGIFIRNTIMFSRFVNLDL